MTQFDLEGRWGNKITQQKLLNSETEIERFKALHDYIKHLVLQP